jgi:hypothetical protein
VAVKGPRPICLCLKATKRKKMASTLLHLSILAFFPVLMALSASMDLLTFTIPNRICVALALGYLIFAILLGVPAVDILLNLSGAVAILAITFTMFSFGLIVAGMRNWRRRPPLGWAGRQFLTMASLRLCSVDFSR